MLMDPLEAESASSALVSSHPLVRPMLNFPLAANLPQDDFSTSPTPSPASDLDENPGRQAVKPRIADTQGSARTDGEKRRAPQEWRESFARYPVALARAIPRHLLLIENAKWPDRIRLKIARPT